MFSPGYKVIGYGAKAKDAISYTLLWSKVCSKEAKVCLLACSLACYVVLERIVGDTRMSCYF